MQVNKPELPQQPINRFDDLIPEQNDIISDAKSEQENKDLVSRSKRKRREDNTLHWAFIVLVWVAAAGVAILIITKISHLFLPDKYCWLNEAHLKKIDEFLTTGIIGGTVTAFFKSKFSKKD